MPSMRTRTALPLVAMAALVTSLVTPSLGQAGAPWTITKQSWSNDDEKAFSEWVQKIGESRCNTVNKCLSGPANYLASSEEKKTYSFVGDCGRYPFILRAYFAWKRGLPFSVVNKVASADGSDRDIRYSPNGNVPVERRDFLGASDGEKAVKAAASAVFTAVYCMDPNLDSNGVGKPFPDFYSPKIGRDSIRPGTVMYDPSGHAAIVYKVEDNGQVRMTDAHPDSSVSYITYDKAFQRSRPGQGAGFKNFRPLKAVDGRVVTISNKNLPLFSLEQYYGTNPVAGSWSKGTFEQNGQRLDYYDYVRASLSVGDLKYNPVDEVKKGVESLCEAINYRAQSVQEAIDHSVHLKEHPSALPKNIYGTDGEWESFSTPSRDARLKVSFLDLRTSIEKYVGLYRAGDSRVVYSGSNLGRDLREAYDQAASACAVEYRRSDNSVVKLSFNDVVKRMYLLSFDPYHCPELRWGATHPNELATCRDSQDKRAWFAAEQGLRNQTQRTYDARMDFSLNQLQQKVPGSGVGQAPDIDLRGYLETL